MKILLIITGVILFEALDIQAQEGMVLVAGGFFEMGLEKSDFDQSPVHHVSLQSFYIDQTEVTVAQFQRFVESAGYKTQAEKDGYCWGYLKGQSDFIKIDGAYWRKPQGRKVALKEILDHPVVCVSWDDAFAYAQWAGKRLPTEAEWEYAARSAGGTHLRADTNRQDPMVLKSLKDENQEGSGQALSPLIKDQPAPAAEIDSVTEAAAVKANIWQGTWPDQNLLEDGYFYTSPVGQFGPNKIGLYDMIGNVWEWTNDWYGEEYYRQSAATNPAGPDTGDKKVARGGSWFCSVNYCGAFSSYYRGASPPGQGFNNVGFRCAQSVD